MATKRCGKISLLLLLLVLEGLVVDVAGGFLVVLLLVEARLFLQLSSSSLMTDRCWPAAIETAVLLLLLAETEGGAEASTNLDKAVAASIK